MNLRCSLLVAIFCLLGIGSSYSQIDRSIAPKAGPAPKIELGESKMFDLKNGLKVIVVENRKLPKVSFQLRLDIHPPLEQEHAGLTTIFGDLLRSGTQEMKKEELDEAIDFIGANLSTSYNGIFGSCLKQHQEVLLQIMSAVALQPSFPADELEKIKKQLKSSLLSERDDPSSIADNVLNALRFGKSHPYGEMVTEETVDGVTLERCKQFYAQQFHPNIAYLVIVGDIDFKEAKSLAKTYFGSWEEGEVEVQNYEQPRRPEERQVVFVEKEGAVQSVIRVSYPIDFKPGNPDFIKTSVMNGILGGGGFSNRLNQNIREDKAYAYGAYSQIDSDKRVGYFEAGADVRNEVTDSAIVEFFAEMERIRTQLVSEEELNLIKNQMSGSFARSLENPQTIARFALNTERYNLPEDYYASYLQSLNAVSREDVREMAIKYVLPDQSYLLVVGNGEAVKGKLELFSPSKQVVQLDYKANLVGQIKTVIPEGMRAEDVMDKYIEALGGAEKLKGIAALHQEMEAASQGMKLAIHKKYLAPHYFAMDILMGENVLQQLKYDGNSAVMQSMQGNKQLEGTEFERLKHEARLDLELQYKELGYDLSLKGVEKVIDREAYAVEIKTPFGGYKVDYFDVETGLKIRSVEIDTDQPQGTITTDYFDYREVEGLKFPFRILEQNGPQQMNLEVTKISVNEAIDKAEFQIN